MYGWIKALHIIAVIAWMAGMLYLPRLFVYHFEAEPGSKQSETFKVMERGLLQDVQHAGLGGGGGRPTPQAGYRPKWSWSSGSLPCTAFLRAGCATSPPTAIATLKSSIGLSM